MWWWRRNKFNTTYSVSIIWYIHLSSRIHSIRPRLCKKLMNTSVKVYEYRSDFRCAASGMTIRYSLRLQQQTTNYLVPVEKQQKVKLLYFVRATHPSTISTILILSLQGALIDRDILKYIFDVAGMFGVTTDQADMESRRVMRTNINTGNCYIYNVASCRFRLTTVVLMMITMADAFSSRKLSSFEIKSTRSVVRNVSRRSTKLQVSLPVGTTDSQPLQHIQMFLTQSVYYKPATEHTQPFWGGSLDPYLSAGKSISPSTKALSDMGITTINDKSNVIAVFGDKITSDNKFIIDSTRIQVEDVMPGFSPTGGILSPHATSTMDPPSVVSFVASIDWASNFVNVIDKLPIAVLVYVLIEFFLLRPNINTYKEDVEENPTGVFADTLAVATVRVSMFCIVAIATVGIFG